MSVFRTAAQAALPSFYTTFAEKITYSRNGETDLVGLDMILSEESAEFETVGDVIIPIKSFFGTIKKIDIDFGSGPVSPVRGDKITTEAGVIYNIEGENPAQEIKDTDEFKIALMRSGT